MINKILGSALFCLLCVGSLLAEGKDPLLVKTSVTGAEIALQLANLEGQKTTIELRDLDNEKLIWSNTVKDHNGYSYEVDMTDLDFGRYYLTVKKGEVSMKQVVVVGTFGVMLSEMQSEL